MKAYELTLTHWHKVAERLAAVAKTLADELTNNLRVSVTGYLGEAQIERLGQHSQQSILSGIIELLRHGSYFVGGIVLLFSIVFPLAKIVFLIELSCLEVLHRRHKAFTLRLMEHAGKWSMMDVMLLAFLVMLVKLGNLVHFQFGPAVIAFVLCVAMSMIASLSFDPHSIWENSSDV